MDEHLLHDTAAGHETHDAHVRPIVKYAAILALTIVLGGGIVFATFEILAANRRHVPEPSPMATEESHVPPQPRLQEHPVVDLDELHSEEDRILSTYGWADKKAGKVRIPISRAMELQLERGFPARKEQPTR